MKVAQISIFLENRTGRLAEVTAILSEGDWRSQANAAKSAGEIAKIFKVTDEALRDALIKCSQSNVMQVYNAANKTLRILAMYEED